MRPRNMIMAPKPIRRGRESNIELLRLIAQFFIVYYHILMICVVPFTDNPIFKALEIPTHIGVILFVLISGYFGIHPTSKGILKLLFIFLVYSIPEVYFKARHASSILELGESFLFFSHTHFWFIRTYVFLYLLSPMVNMFIEKARKKQLVYMLCALFFISIYIGNVGGDPTLNDGKNIANFIFIYMLGFFLRSHSFIFEKVKISLLLTTFIILNAILIVGYTLASDNFVGKVLWHIAYPYSSPVLLLNSILFFLMFCRISFQSRIINYLAKSSLAIYLIHANRPLFIDWHENMLGDFPGGIIGFMVSVARDFCNNDYLYSILLIGVTIIIISICIGIDKLLSPVWNIGNRFFGVVYNKLGF